MPVTFTSKRSYWETRAKLRGDELYLHRWLEDHARPEGWTIREISKEMGWEAGRVSARLNPLVFPPDQDDAVLVDRLPLKRYCKVTNKLAFAHRAACSDPQGRFF